MDAKIYAFVKVGQKNHLESLQKDGLLYMNTLGYLRKIEGMSGDKNEGTMDFFQGKKIKLVILPHSRQDPFPAKGLISMQSSYSPDLKKNVFCMHAITDDYSALDEKNFERSSHALVIFNPQEFLELLNAAVSKDKADFYYGFVEYVDKKTYHGQMGCFKKFEEFKYENEYRIMRNYPTGKPFPFTIGSLEDISELVKVKDVVTRIKKFLEAKRKS